MNGARSNGAQRPPEPAGAQRVRGRSEAGPEAAGDRELVAARRPPVAVIEAALAGELSVHAGEASAAERILLDTFDGRLRSRELALRWQDGELALLGGEDGRALASAATLAPVAPLAESGLPEGELRRALAPIIRPRALLPLARLTVTTQTLALLDSLEKTVVRIVVESPLLVAPRGRPRELATRLHLAGIRGYDEELTRAHRLLTRALGLEPAERTLFEEAVSAAGGRPEGVDGKIAVRLDRRERADTAAVRVLRRLLEVSDANLPGALADTDPEFLHDLRVSIRRTRTVQRQLRAVFPSQELARVRGEFRWLQRATGHARDLDVHVSGFEQMRALAPASVRADLSPLLVVLRRRRMVAHGVMARDLRSDRARNLRSDWEALLDGLLEAPEGDRPDARRPIAEVAGKRIWRVYRDMLRQGRALGADSSPEEYHELRKQGKELRYLLELFGAPLHGRSAVKPMVRTLKQLQDVLGHHQDREVQIGMLHELGDEVCALPGGSRALMAMGVLIERLEADAAAVRADFAQHFAPFAAGSQRKQVRKAFAK